jgi:hypothetical protein
MLQYEPLKNSLGDFFIFLFKLAYGLKLKVIEDTHSPFPIEPFPSRATKIGQASLSPGPAFKK